MNIVNDRRAEMPESAQTLEQKDETIAQLEAKLADSKNKVDEERFIWVIICILL